MPFPVTTITLNQNIITAALFNMIISQQVFDSNVASTELADRFRVDGTLFGDTKLFHSFDIGNPEDWLNDAEAPNLLALARNKSGKTQSIVMGVYKIIAVTIDQYLSKQAFMRDGSFAEYTSFLTGSLRKIKRVYDRSLINTKIGTLVPSTTRCDIGIQTPTGDTLEETNRLEAQTIASKMVILRADLEDNNRDFNALDYLRSYPANELIAVWNVDWHAKITKLDLPTIFHKDIGVDGGFREYDIPAKWFGTPATAVLSISNAASVAGKRFLISGWYEIASAGTMVVTPKPTATSFYFYAGDQVPYNGQVLTDNVRKLTLTCQKGTLAAANYYNVDASIAFVIVHASALPFMSGFETGTEFWNARSLTTNHYLIFGHNNLEYLEEYPRIRVKVTKAP